MLLNGKRKQEFVSNEFKIFFEVSGNLFSAMEIYFDTGFFISLGICKDQWTGIFISFLYTLVT